MTSYLNNIGVNGMLIMEAVAIKMGSMAQGMVNNNAAFLNGLFSA
jgi:hypothetical protein